MAYGKMANPGPDSEEASLYEDSSGNEERGENEEHGEENDAAPTATLPKSILAGKDFSPGDELILRVDKIGSDEIVVSYSTGKDSNEEEEPTDKPSPSTSKDAEYDSMME